MKKTAPSISKRQTKVAQKTSQQRRPDTGESKNFVESKCFKGAKKGYIFKMDKNGVGYYKDTYYKRPLSQPKRYRQQPQQQQQKQSSLKQNKNCEYMKFPPFPPKRAFFEGCVFFGTFFMKF